MAKQSTAILYAFSAAVLAFALLHAQLGFFIIDEVLYLFAADTFRLGGGLILDNGLHLAPSTDLNWTELVPLGPSGLTSQYPPGTTFVWAPLLSLFGERAIIVLSAVAAVGAVFATRGLALRLFGDPVVAVIASLLLLFATFMLEYAFVYWPHTMSVWTVALSFCLFLDALDDRRGTVLPAMLSGLVLGVGLLFRLDAFLLLPIFTVLAVTFAARPVRLLIGGAIGVAPAFAILALVNREKFGTFNPLSYGGTDGLTRLEVYLPFAAVGLAALALLALVRLRPPTSRTWPPIAAAATVVVVAAVALIPALRAFVADYAVGSYRLLIDSRNIESELNGVVALPNGTTLFWGLPKKALAQSMPWLGLLLILTLPGFWRGRARSLAIALTFAVIFSFPFAATAWHGGMSSNMRYFLPLMPFLAILAAVILDYLMQRAPGHGPTLAVAVIAGAAFPWMWTALAPTGLAGAHQIWSLYLFAAVAFVALAAAHIPSPRTTIAALVLGGLGLGTAAFNTASDMYTSQLRRAEARPLSDLAYGYSGKVLIYDLMLRSALVDPDQVIALRSRHRDGPDEVLVRAALADEYRVLMPAATATAFVERFAAYDLRTAEGPGNMAEVFWADRPTVE
ncbi:MAG: hypothetical protein QNJ13_03180 [Paracoccaceae bacterium]|nr:hypothetical protein [Paracoccaceae bacterium]